MVHIKHLAIAAVFWGCFSVGWTAQPVRFNYQAKLTDSVGTPLTGMHDLTFWIYQGGTAGDIGSGTQQFKETASVNIQNGIVNHTVGTGIPAGPALAGSVFKTDADLFLQV